MASPRVAAKFEYFMARDYDEVLRRFTEACNLHTETIIVHAFIGRLARPRISGVRRRTLMLQYPLCREHNKDVTGGTVNDILCLIPVIWKVLKFHKIRFHQGNA